MTKHRYSTYICRVSDPEKPETLPAVYRNIRAVSTRHADRQARDGWCGLLGVDQAVHERLEVEIEKVP